jgi:dTDP-4-dehydrorhamnose reductase
MYTLRPEFVIYAAGSPDRLEAEKEPKVAEAVHTGGPVIVADAIGSVGSKFIFLSSCYTFDGSKGNYRELDTLIPDTSIGKVKVGGENFIRSKSSNYVIVRSVPLLGIGNGNRPTFLDQWRLKLDQGEPIVLPTNELHSFVTVKALVELIERIMDSGVRNSVYHFGGLDKLSWYDLGRLFAERFGYSPELIQSSVEGPELDYSLNCTKAAKELKIQPLFLKESFDLID